MVVNFSSISPIDGKTVWNGRESVVSAIDETMVRATVASQNWRRTPLASRIQVVRNYRDVLESGRSEIQNLIVREVGKLPWDAAGEVNASIAKIELSIQALQQRRSAQQIRSGPDREPIATPNRVSTSGSHSCPRSLQLPAAPSRRTDHSRPAGWQRSCLQAKRTGDGDWNLDGRCLAIRWSAE